MFDPLHYAAMLRVSGLSFIFALGLLVLVGCAAPTSTPTPTRTPPPMATSIPTPLPTSTPTLTPTPTPPPTSGARPSDGLAGEVPVFKEITVWGQDTDGDVHFSSPNGIAVDSSGNVYVTEFRGHRVQKFTADGALLLQWGSEGSQKAQFQNPTGISIDQDDNVYIAESGNHRVQKFTADGEWLAAWGSQGSGRGRSTFLLGLGKYLMFEKTRGYGLRWSSKVSELSKRPDSASCIPKGQ